MNKIGIFPKNPLLNSKVELEKLLNANRAELKELLAQPKITYMNFIRPFMEASERVSVFFTPISHLQSVKNSKESQEAFTECIGVLTAYGTELSHNKAVYNVCVSVRDKEYKSLNKVQQKVLDDMIFDFELEGVALPDSKKERVKEINIRLSELSNDFSQNLLNATNAYKLEITDEAILGEMPDSDKSAALLSKQTPIPSPIPSQIPIPNKWVFTLQMPSYIAFMTYCTDRGKREEMYKAYCTRSPENGKLIVEILSLRAEKAAILGEKSFADLNLRTMSAPSVEAVLEFLRKLGTAGKPYAMKDKQQLSEYAKKDGISDLNSYDLAYYSEKLKKADYDYDEEQLRPYFEMYSTVERMFQFLEELFGIHFKAKPAELWDAKAKFFEVYVDGKLIGGLYTDLEAREDKRGGAWMNDWHSHHKDPKGVLHLPEAFIVGNFPVSKAGNPSLLRHDDVTTLFHEMGHALHHLLSKVDEAAVSGVNGIDWDTVEFPSQFLENFAYDYDVLQKIGKHYTTGNGIPKELLDKVIAAKNFQAGMGLVRQLEFGIFDMLIHQKAYDEKAAQQILDGVRNEVAVMFPPTYNKFQNGFAHIFGGGYAAGYYSYKWAEMLSSDAYCEFIDKGVFNKPLAKRYVDTVLAMGAGTDMGQIYQAFMGRSPDPTAILRLSGMK